MDTMKFMMAVILIGVGLTTGRGVGQTPDCANQVLLLDGNSWIRVADHPDLDFTTSITIEFWHNVSQVTSRGVVIAKYGDNGIADRSYCALLTELTGQPQFDFNIASTAIQNSSNVSEFIAGSYSLNQWQHVAMTFDGNSRKLYLDGVFVAEKIFPMTIHQGITDLSIGGWLRSNSGPTMLYYTGMIDELRLWSNVRTQAEIQATMDIRIDAAAVPSYPGLVTAWNFEGNALDATGVHNGMEVGNVQYVLPTGAPIPLDCNGNGSHDCEDIANGTSTDCNGNTIPDECDLTSGFSLDCNGNGLPDSCDLLSGASMDVDGNGVPDECECLADIAPIFANGTHGNGVVNIDDLVLLLNSFGQSTPPGEPTVLGDVNYNGVVNIDDLVAVLNGFGVCP